MDLDAIVCLVETGERLTVEWCDGVVAMCGWWSEYEYHRGEFPVQSLRLVLASKREVIE